MPVPPPAPLGRPEVAPGSTRLPRRVVLGYGAGSVGTGAFSAVPGLLLLFFLTDTLGVAPGLAAVVLVAPKVWDLVVDPFRGAAGGLPGGEEVDRLLLSLPPDQVERLLPAALGVLLSVTRSGSVGPEVVW